MILSTLCYIEKEGNYLMLHRTKKKNDISQDKWLGIGGKFEAGESPEECIQREVREETGLNLLDKKLRGIVTYVSDVFETEYMYVYTSNDFDGQQIKECDEGDLEWISKEKVLDLPTWEGDKIFVQMIQKEEPFFSIKFIYEGEKLMDYTINSYC